MYLKLSYHKTKNFLLQLKTYGWVCLAWDRWSEYCYWLVLIWLLLNFFASRILKLLGERIILFLGGKMFQAQTFDYLGCRFTSYGDDAAGMRHHIAIAGGAHDYLWRDNRLPRSLKLRLYAASVCSTLTHGSEAWTLTTTALATLDGFNSRQLHRITAEASVAGPHPADACEPPSALCGVSAGPTSWNAVPTWQPPDGHAPPTRTGTASRRPPRMGTRWPIPLLPHRKAPFKGYNL